MTRFQTKYRKIFTFAVIPDSIRNLGETWHECFTIIVTRPRVEIRGDEKNKKGHKVTMGIKRACKIYISFSLKWIDTEKSLHSPSFRIQSEISGKHGTNVLPLRDETPC